MTTHRDAVSASISSISRSDATMAMDAKAKPPGSLGVLEDWAIKYASMMAHTTIPITNTSRLAMLQGTLRPVVTAPCLLLFAADHGIAAARPEVSAYPRAVRLTVSLLITNSSQVTASVFNAIARGQAASCALCASSNITLRLTDVGVDCDTTSTTQTADEGIHVTTAKACPHGTASFIDAPAMTAAETEAAMAAGRRAVQEARAAGGNVVAVGELGIGNTTSAAALLAALTGAPPEAVCGRGTGTWLSVGIHVLRC